MIILQNISALSLEWNTFNFLFLRYTRKTYLSTRVALLILGIWRLYCIWYFISFILYIFLFIFFAKNFSSSFNKIILKILLFFIIRLFKRIILSFQLIKIFWQSCINFAVNSFCFFLNWETLSIFIIFVEILIVWILSIIVLTLKWKKCGYQCTYYSYFFKKSCHKILKNTIWAITNS